MVYKYYTNKYKQLKEDSIKEGRSRSNLARKIMMDNIYTFNDEELKQGKPKTRHNVRMESITLSDEDYELIEKVAKHYNMDTMKFIAYIIHQYYENKENK